MSVFMRLYDLWKWKTDHRYIWKNRPKYRHEQYDLWWCFYVLSNIKQHLSNIWRSIDEKVKQHWGWFEKRHCLQKKAFIPLEFTFKL